MDSKGRTDFIYAEVNGTFPNLTQNCADYDFGGHLATAGAPPSVRLSRWPHLQPASKRLNQ